MAGIRLTDQPTAYTEFVRQVMYLMLAFDVVKWTDAQQALVLSVVSASMALFVWNKVISLNTLHDAGHTAREMKDKAAIRTGTGDGSNTGNGTGTGGQQ